MNNNKLSAVSQAVKRDSDNYKKKLKVLERKLKEEDVQNKKIFNMRKGEFVEYGNELMLLHVDSKCFLQATKQCADEDNSCNKAELTINGSRNAYFKALGGFKYK